MYFTRREGLAQLVRRDDDDDNCGSGGGDTGSLGLRIASVFIVMFGSLLGALFPVLSRRTKWLAPHVPKGVFEFAKYFGSGVIVGFCDMSMHAGNCLHMKSPDCHGIYPSVGPGP